MAENAAKCRFFIKILTGVAEGTLYTATRGSHRIQASTLRQMVHVGRPFQAADPLSSGSLEFVKYHLDFAYRLIVCHRGTAPAMINPQLRNPLESYSIM